MVAYANMTILVMQLCIQIAILHKNDVTDWAMVAILFSGSGARKSSRYHGNMHEFLFTAS